MSKCGGGKEISIMEGISAHPELLREMDPDLFEAVMACVLQRVAENARSVTIEEIIADGSVTDVLIADDLDGNSGQTHDAVVHCLSVLSTGNISGSSTKGLGKVELKENGETVAIILHPEFFTVDNVKRLVAEIRDLASHEQEDDTN